MSDEIKEKKEKKEMKFWKKWLLILALGLVVGAGTAIVFLIIKTRENEPQSVMQSDVESDLEEGKGDLSPSEPVKTDNVSKNMNVSSTDFSAIVDSVLPSVVSIKCVSEQTVSSYDPFEDLFDFGYGYDYDYGYGSPSTQEVSSSGTGFIIGQNGDELLLVTNNHVVENAKSITIKFVDDTEVEATIKGNDTSCDLAVLSVDGSKLSKDTLGKIRIATVGNSDEMKVGDITIAIGNALGYGQSVTVGYVSALNRTVTLENNTEMTLLQTDTAINEGNSGGPLLNIYGEVIGITNANRVKRSSTSKTEGVCYAIPLAKVIPIINELMNRVDLSPNEAGYLGIKGKEVTESYSKAFGMPKGLYVSSIDKGSPAIDAGIRVGDIITAINGRQITNMDDLKEILSYIKYGTEVEVSFYSLGNNGYQEKDVKVTLGKRSAFETDKS